MENDVKVRPGEEWVCGLDEKRVTVTKAYESEVHMVWLEDGARSVMPRDFFVDLFFPSYLLEAK